MKPSILSVFKIRYELNMETADLFLLSSCNVAIIIPQPSSTEHRPPSIVSIFFFFGHCLSNSSLFALYHHFTWWVFYLYFFCLFLVSMSLVFWSTCCRLYDLPTSIWFVLYIWYSIPCVHMDETCWLAFICLAKDKLTDDDSEPVIFFEWSFHSDKTLYFSAITVA